MIAGRCWPSPGGFDRGGGQTFRVYEGRWQGSKEPGPAGSTSGCKESS